MSFKFMYFFFEKHKIAPDSSICLWDQRSTREDPVTVLKAYAGWFY